MEQNSTNQFCLFEINKQNWFVRSENVNSLRRFPLDEKSSLRTVYLEPKTYAIGLILEKDNLQIALGIDRILPLGTPIDESFKEFIIQNHTNENDRKQILIESENVDSEKTIPYLFFEVQNKNLAFPLNEVVEIVSKNDMQEKVLVSERSNGFLNRRGLIIPVLQLLPESKKMTDNQTGALIVIQRDSCQISFPVDKVVRLEHLIQNQINEKKLIETSNVYWEITSSEHFLSFNEIERHVRGYQNIFQTTNIIHLNSKSSYREEAYLEFFIHEKLHISLSDIVALDTLTVETSQTNENAYLGDQIWNGKSIPVFDGRKLYGFDKNIQILKKQKVIYIQKNDSLFGVLVDEIRGIFRVNTHLKRQFPRILLRCYSQEFQNDITDFFQTIDIKQQSELNITIPSFELVVRTCKQRQLSHC